MLPNLIIGDTVINLYNAINSFALLAAAAYCLLLWKQENLLLGAWCDRLEDCAPGKKAKSVVVTLAGSALLIFLMFQLQGLLNTPWVSLFGPGRANYFGQLILGSAAFGLVCRLLRINPLKQMDLYAPALAISLIFYKLACLMCGCCRGKAWDHGLYFIANHRREFPSQLLEMAVAVFLLLLLFDRGKKQRVPGELTPIYLIAYSATRFFTEFTRDNPAVFLGLQNYQLQCLLGVVLGGASLWFVRKYGQRISDRCDARIAAIRAERKGTQETEEV